jgi:hypothetical protein
MWIQIYIEAFFHACTYKWGCVESCSWLVRVELSNFKACGHIHVKPNVCRHEGL